MERRGITLVEVLIVVAIVLVLVSAVTVIVLNGGRKGGVARCLSNLHQLGVAVRAYAADNDGLSPISGHGGSAAVGAWKSCLEPYAETDVFYCPNDKYARLPQDSAKGNSGRSFHRSYDEWVGLGAVETEQLGAYVTPLDSVPDPSIRAYLNDYTVADRSRCQTDENGSYYGNVSPHGPMYSVLYWDGHVKHRDNPWFRMKHRIVGSCP